MDIDEIISKDPKDINDDERRVLEDSKFDLDEDVAARFGLDTTPNVPDPVVRGADENDGAEGVSAGDEEETEDDRILAKTITKHMSPLQKQLERQNALMAEQRSLVEVESFVREDKTGLASRYKDAMLKYIKAYPNVPVSGIFKIVAGDDLMREGARRERRAASKAAATRVNSGNSSVVRNSGEKKGKDWGAASKDDYLAKRAEVLGRPI